MQGPQVDASYGLNPTPQSPIGSERVGVKGKISHPTLNIVFEIGDLLRNCYGVCYSSLVWGQFVTQTVIFHLFGISKYSYHL